jgi:membrane dipeptidase
VLLVETVTPAARALHDDCLVVDLHADTLEMVRLGLDLGREHRSLWWVGHVLGHVDLPRMRQGGLGVQAFGVVVPPWTRAGRALDRVRAQVDLLDRCCARFPDRLCRVRTAAEAQEARRGGRIGALVGVEGSYGLVGDPGAAVELARLGVTYVGPAHIFSSRDVPSSLTRASGRLTGAAWTFIEELRDAGVLVDLAHMARGPFLEVCEAASAPVVVSHTGLAALRPMWRNIDDDQVRAVARTGGVIGVIFTPRFLGIAGVEGIVRHLEHLVDVGGQDVAALGSDFDGLVRPPRDLADVSGLPRITQALLDRGVPERVIRKILGENVLRVLPADQSSVRNPPQSCQPGSG